MIEPMPNDKQFIFYWSSNENYLLISFHQSLHLKRKKKVKYIKITIPMQRYSKNEVLNLKYKPDILNSDQNTSQCSNKDKVKY